MKRSELVRIEERLRDDGFYELDATTINECFEKTVQGKPVDAVARFHLGNGARVERINWAGDPSAKGMKQSFGLMVNYLYDLKRIPSHWLSGKHCSFSSCCSGTTKTAFGVIPTGTPKASEISKLPGNGGCAIRFTISSSMPSVSPTNARKCGAPMFRPSPIPRMKAGTTTWSDRSDSVGSDSSWDSSMSRQPSRWCYCWI